MKKIITVFAINTFALSALAASPSNYDALVPQDLFSITHEKSKLKENVDSSRFKIEVTPKKEEFIFRVDDIKTPRKNFFAGKSDFKLTVVKENGKISRITSSNFAADDKQPASGQLVQTTALDSEGYVSSRTFCSESFKINFLGLRSKRSGFNCATVNKGVCDYLVKNNIEAQMLEEIKACSDTLAKFNTYQKELNQLSKKDQARDVKAMGKISSAFKDPGNFYELEADTLVNVSGIIAGYGEALAQCQQLNQGGFFPSDSSHEEPSHSGKPKSNKQ